MRRRIQSLYQDHSSERNHQECLQCSLEELASLRNLSKGAIAIKEHTRRWSGLNRPLKIRAMLVDSDLNLSVVINALQPVAMYQDRTFGKRAVAFLEPKLAALSTLQYTQDERTETAFLTC